MPAVEDSSGNRPNCLQRGGSCVCNSYQQLLDKSTPHIAVRWVVWLFLLIFYLVRTYILQGWYIITYALGIFLLNLFIAFLTPKVDPAQTIDIDAPMDVCTFNDGPSLPTVANEEFRPFMRRLPEFKFWYSALRAVLIALFLTCFDAFNIPVFWPILVMYFFLLFTVMMKKQILHMIEYRYLPFSYGKTKYAGKEDTPVGKPVGKTDHL